MGELAPTLPAKPEHSRDVLAHELWDRAARLRGATEDRPPFNHSELISEVSRLESAAMHLLAATATMNLNDAAIARRNAKIDRLEEALRPGAETKATYAGQFKFTRDTIDKDGDIIAESVTVPWETISEIMTTILLRASAPQAGVA